MIFILAPSFVISRLRMRTDDTFYTYYYTLMLMQARSGTMIPKPHNIYIYSIHTMIQTKISAGHFIQLFCFLLHYFIYYSS